LPGTVLVTCALEYALVTRIRDNMIKRRFNVLSSPFIALKLSQFVGYNYAKAAIFYEKSLVIG
jgi:hypothetical protein